MVKEKNNIGLNEMLNPKNDKTILQTNLRNHLYEFVFVFS